VELDQEAIEEAKLQVELRDVLHETAALSGAALLPLFECRLECFRCPV
jgi:hypothetical protein